MKGALDCEVPERSPDSRVNLPVQGGGVWLVWGVPPGSPHKRCAGFSGFNMIFETTPLLIRRGF